MINTTKNIYLCVPVYIYEGRKNCNVNIEFDSLEEAEKMAEKIQKINSLDTVEYESRHEWLKEYLYDYIGDGFAIRDDCDARLSIVMQTVQTEQMGDFSLYCPKH